jgi:hypothetical protein
MSIFSKVMSAAGSRRRPWVLAVFTLITVGTTEALGVGLYYSVERARLYTFAHRESDWSDMAPAVEIPPCPNRMQPPSCLASQASTSESISDTEIVLKLLEVRNAGLLVPASDRPVPPERDLEPADTP